MSPASSNVMAAAPSAATVDHAGARDHYFALGKADPAASELDAARGYLQDQLRACADLPADLPDDIDAIGAWIDRRGAAIGEQYRQYLQQRRDGAPRRYFSNKSHALYFLKSVAPTKLVDGSWLYGLLPRWHDIDFRPLIKTYLEELGDGVAEKNHVVLYRKLLAAHGCEAWQDLSDDHFVQGAIQLALAYHAEHFLPEVIGFNLGYEQLPLHLLITSYELNELGIDPYYFTLHVTVDNADTGHARKAAQGLRELMPRVGDAAAFYHRVRDGYRLNDLGAGTTAVIAGFDLEAELLALLADKSAAGKNMHSDYCRVGGRSVNDWLATPAQIPAFLDALIEAGWIKRGASVEQSRFWRLVHSEDAAMFGVFSSYEQQVLKDWIEAPEAAQAPRQLTYRQRQRARSALASQNRGDQPWPQRGLLRHCYGAAVDGQTNELSELALLERRLADSGDKAAAMALLIPLMSPAHHHSAAGLMATRIYSKLLD
ncbi:iron-containing redox enzyme family protein [Rugamonas sp.]|uniref:iron-containing redox enzyme family protein n=1 Tax=Rugamonas sp. TaxID=1926287 RepID=UPI0025DD4474|nr:iron-containing redox enzyme family protein [Rugamonas sp.]